MEEKGPLIGYWKIRGLGELVKLIMEYGKKPYQMFYYQAGPPPQFDRKEWFDKKFCLGLDFPNLPYLIDGDLHLCESMGICLYLAEKYVPELMGKTEIEHMQVFEAMCVIREIRDILAMHCYIPGENMAQNGVNFASERVQQVVKKLGKNDWLVGDSPTVSDLFLMEITDFLQMITKGAFLKDHPTIEAHNTRTKEIPNIKEYKNSPRFFDGPFNSPVAHTNNVPEDYWD